MEEVEQNIENANVMTSSTLFPEEELVGIEVGSKPAQKVGPKKIKKTTFLQGWRGSIETFFDSGNNEA
jgi:hypothetical protein